MHDTRQTLSRRLPANYFADAPTLSPAGQLTAASHNSPHGNTGASPELALPAPADDAADDRQGTSSAQQLHAARTIFGKQS